jgi:hypothetical protein
MRARLKGEANPNFRHGMFGTPTYRAWAAMIQRCKNPNRWAYQFYGKRGIKVCRKWKSFVGFYADMGHRPSQLHTLDRTDNNKGYSKSNCRWATRKDQARNRRSSKFIRYNGQSKTIAEWSDITGLSQELIRNRVNDLKWPVKLAMTTKPSLGRNQEFRRTT